MDPNETTRPAETPKRRFLDRFLRRPEPPKGPTAVDADVDETQRSVEEILKVVDATPDDLQESVEPIQVGHFLVKPADMAARTLAENLSTNYDKYRSPLNLDPIKKPNTLEEVKGEERDSIAKRILETQDPSHKKKAKIRVDGVYKIGETNLAYEDSKARLGHVTSKWDDSPSAPRLLLHGTDKSRGCTIMNNGFRRIYAHKTDTHPMFGSGISTCAQGSKAGKYFHEEGYNSRDRRDGLIFCIEAAAGKVKDVEVGMWGDTIDGKNWWEQYDTIHAIPSRAKDPHNGSRVYFDEWTLAHPEQASIKYVVHCTYVPASDPEYANLP